MHNRLLHSLLYIAAFALFFGLSFTLLNIERVDSTLHTELLYSMPSSGVTHQVTAVLLNFRALDTLLEVAVILLSLLAIYTLNEHYSYTPLSFESSITNTFASILFALIMLYAFYILYSGSYQSGGAFSAAALLAGGIIIMQLVKPHSFSLPRESLLRILYASGLLYFVSVGIVSMLFGSFLGYRDKVAALYILSIESVLMLSLGAILSAYFINAVRGRES